ncbi:thiopurine S-methyltransferase [Mangrovimicrobium sediminis]|uniref:Thiopurine S-methyltransferase n=1 Tax=Mangrovimicrobium sediminis TaxID=2562682 RepID=A0A4Z0M4T4_9GAMM|nr:thiopurine S-methyltransferase [Haliea sp. SAOS-164]TGD74315.1 thiopurine S-methyltransferase [Haliea sp. SAOS-164]
MQAEFWKTKWHTGEIGFHLDDVNPMLARHIDALGLAAGARLLLPLCGKTRDIAWLLSRGFSVIGVELVEDAVRQLFAELGVEPQVSEEGGLKRYSVEGLDILVGDFFATSASAVGPVDAVYDRAALVALPAPMRERYTAHLRAVSGGVRQLLIAYVYDQSLADGPPFSVTDAEVERHYAAHYRLTRLVAEPVPGGLKGKYPAQEHVWLLADV